MNVLIACEESQTVCKAFLAKGHNVYSCDILECSGGLPERHITEDVLRIINGHCTFYTQDNTLHTELKNCTWDLIIAHPPCTYLTVTGNRWFNVEKYGEKALERHKLRAEAAIFFMNFVNADCERIAIENPIGYMSSHYRRADQCIQPYMFGDPFEKKTCLWLKGLPKLLPTNIVEPQPRVIFNSGKSMPAWYAEAWHLSKEERSRVRSKTFRGVALAMAEQWG